MAARHGDAENLLPNFKGSAWHPACRAAAGTGNTPLEAVLKA